MIDPSKTYNAPNACAGLVISGAVAVGNSCIVPPNSSISLRISDEFLLAAISGKLAAVI